MENFELHAEMTITANEMMIAVNELAERAKEYATAHRDFKRERAIALLNSTHRTVAEREAQADVDADEYRFKNYLTEGLMDAARERVRSLRAKLSALQTLANGNREESQFTRTSPHV